jgi:hypothetical protein
VTARNILLFTILLDDDFKNEPKEIYWSILYDIFLQPRTLATIKRQAENLIKLSSSLATWQSSKYSDTIHIVNSTTLQSLRKSWQNCIKWSDPTTNAATAKSYKSLLSSITQTNSQGESTFNLTKSFGALSSQSHEYAVFHSSYFWFTGVSDRSGKNGPPTNIANPLMGVEVRTFSPRENPIAGEHLAGVLAPLGRDSKFLVDMGGLVPALAAKMPKLSTMYKFPGWEFGKWGGGFREWSGDKARRGKLRLRFFVGDASALCFGIARVRNGVTSPLSSYVQPCGDPLKLDGADYLPGADEPAPLSFNVIDAGDLQTTHGLLNIFVSAIPLLEKSPSSVIFTQTHTTAAKDELNLLSNMLLADVGDICTLLGIAPLPFLTGISPNGYHQDTGLSEIIEDYRSVTNHIVWKLSTSGDPASNNTSSTVTVDQKEFAEMLYNLYINMFPVEDEHHLEKQMMECLSKPSPFADEEICTSDFYCDPPQYTRRSFAAFLAFLKSRVNVDWDVLIDLLLAKIPESKMTRMMTGSARGTATKMNNSISPRKKANEMPINSI